MATQTINKTAARDPRSRPVVTGVGRLVRRLEHERRKWTRPGRDTGEALATEVAWRAGVAEGLRLAQTAIRKGV